MQLYSNNKKNNNNMATFDITPYSLPCNIIRIDTLNGSGYYKPLDAETDRHLISPDLGSYYGPLDVFASLKSGQIQQHQQLFQPHTLGLVIYVDNHRSGKGLAMLESAKPMFAKVRSLTLVVLTADLETTFIDPLIFSGCFNNITKLNLFDNYYYDNECSYFVQRLMLQHKQLFDGLACMPQLRWLGIYLPLVDWDLQEMIIESDFLSSLHQYLVNNRSLDTFKFPKQALGDQTLDYLLSGGDGHKITKLSIALRGHIPIITRPLPYQVN
ncbi:hypothetical protein SAMD00019534_003490 [Acytostelium subglobosum LB1]|uniref:hypothetical protein n=1 Tax=Acytostelium subglobosum LB1 TaxID=1410327 RepID=UPI000644EE94|nr:hypothetical protein SAMD00019534_003490 [Acytostelium subglobosum LB1]GAM17174.1 hypothetical protein SAMD00019534_003490 [Acytostelium subglobosum LB1]|eukprot:XP_012759236.1 hypothetical protein SAMD00019534_003490 [Acytostelium subglobosum LB1]